ncbi:basic salivary proline-rich protein 2-like [Cinclus cinclus]|uniref:basic salivary proline-rich protein 2-like n=1 Tax=Cinclus cinclus TaxID=127875 RepID=UPI002E126FD1
MSLRGLSTDPHRPLRATARNGGSPLRTPPPPRPSPPVTFSQNLLVNPASPGPEPPQQPRGRCRSRRSGAGHPGSANPAGLGAGCRGAALLLVRADAHPRSAPIRYCGSWGAVRHRWFLIWSPPRRCSQSPPLLPSPPVTSTRLDRSKGQEPAGSCQSLTFPSLSRSPPTAETGRGAGRRRRPRAGAAGGSWRTGAGGRGRERRRKGQEEELRLTPAELSVPWRTAASAPGKREPPPPSAARSPAPLRSAPHLALPVPPRVPPAPEGARSRRSGSEGRARQRRRLGDRDGRGGPSAQGRDGWSARDGRTGLGGRSLPSLLTERRPGRRGERGGSQPASRSPPWSPRGERSTQRGSGCRHLLGWAGSRKQGVAPAAGNGESAPRKPRGHRYPWLKGVLRGRGN